MRKISFDHHTLVFLLIIFLLNAFKYEIVVAGDVAEPAGATAAAGSNRLAVYRPPMRGAPSTRVRVGGASRGSEGSTSGLYVLTPDHTGLTSMAQPILYWFASQPVSSSFEFSLITDHDMKTVIEQELEVGSRAGIHSLSLKEMGVSLTPGVSYQWSVAIVIDREQRSRDIFASSTIRRIPQKKVPSSVRADSGGEDAVLRYAEAGLWYDALSAISRLIKEHPGEKHFVEQRAALLDQVGLVEVVTYEKDRMF